MSKWMRNCEIGSRAGLTLVEVVASLALMGSLLVSAITGAAIHLRQIRLASQKQMAIEGVDRLLSVWALYQFADQKWQDAATAANVSLLDSAEPSSIRDTGRPFAVRYARQPQALTAGYDIEIVRVEAINQTTASLGQLMTWVEIARPKTRTLIP